MSAVVNMPSRALVVLVLATFASCRQSISLNDEAVGKSVASPVDARPVVRLDLGLKVLGKLQRFGERVRIQVTLTNYSSVPMWLNTRLAQNHPQSFPAERELWLEVKRSDGKSVRYSCVNNYVLTPGDSDYSLLAKGDSISKAMIIECYDLSPGDYQVIAFYADGNPEPPLAPRGSLYSRGMLVSDAQTFTVESDKERGK